MLQNGMPSNKSQEAERGVMGYFDRIGKIPMTVGGMGWLIVD